MTGKVTHYILKNKQDWQNLAYLCLLPVLLALVNDSWLFDLPGESDSAMYQGYFHHFGQHLWEYENCYKISRIPWILTGFTVFKLFTPLVAHFILALLNLWVFLVAFYLVIRQHTTATVALVASLCLASYTYLHHSGGWYYHNLQAHTFYLISLLLVVKAARKDSRVWLFISACFFVTAVHINSLLINFAPVIWGLYLLENSEGNGWVKASIPFVLFFIVGGIIITLFWGFISWASGSSFWFFIPQWKHVWCLLLGKDVIPQSQPFMNLIVEAYHLVFPVFMGVISLILLLVHRKEIGKHTRQHPHFALLIYILFIHPANG